MGLPNSLPSQCHIASPARISGRFGQVHIEAIRRDRGGFGLTDGELRVYAVLVATRNVKTGLAFISRSTLARQCGFHPDHISRVVAKLARVGLIKRLPDECKLYAVTFCLLPDPTISQKPTDSRKLKPTKVNKIKRLNAQGASLPIQDTEKTPIEDLSLVGSPEPAEEGEDWEDWRDELFILPRDEILNCIAAAEALGKEEEAEQFRELLAAQDQETERRREMESELEPEPEPAPKPEPKPAPPPPKPSPGPMPRLWFDESNRLDRATLHTLAALLAGIPAPMAQILLDELAGFLVDGKVRHPVAYLRSLVQRWQAGTFIPERAQQVAERRRRRQENEARERWEKSPEGRAARNKEAWEYLERLQRLHAGKT